MVPTDTTIAKGDRIAQPGAASLPMVNLRYGLVFADKMIFQIPMRWFQNNMKEQLAWRLPACQILRFGKIGHNRHGLGHLLFTQDEILQVACQVFLISGQVQQTMTAE